MWTSSMVQQDGYSRDDGNLGEPVYPLALDWDSSASGHVKLVRGTCPDPPIYVPWSKKMIIVIKEQIHK